MLYIINIQPGVEATEKVNRFIRKLVAGLVGYFEKKAGAYTVRLSYFYNDIQA